MKFASFGDEGTTASVNKYGHLIQISRNLDCGMSGVFCAEVSKLGQTDVLNRPSILREVMDSSDESIGFRLTEEILGDNMPQLDFLHGCWPRFTYQTPRLQIVLQYFCRNGVVTQHYTVESKEPGKGLPTEDLSPFKICSSPLIRDTEFDNFMNPFNSEAADAEGYSTVLGPRKFGLVRTHQGYRELNLEDTRRPMFFRSSKKRDVDNVVGLAMTPLLNGVVQKVKQSGEKADGICLDIDEIPHYGRFEVTMLYKLRRLQTSDNPWAWALVPAVELSSMQKTVLQTPFTHLSFSSDTVLDFIIKRNLEHILSVCSIPSGQPSSLTEDLDFDKDDTPNSSLDQHGMSKEQIESTASFSDHLSGDKPLGHQGRSTVRPTGSSRDDEQTMQRNSAIALTCGDISGHRIDASASL